MKNMMEGTAAIVLAAGSGSRMGAAEKKQYMQLGGMPLICHALRAFEESFVADVILVVPPEDIDYCAKEIVERFGFTKVRAVIAGGEERYLSVAAGLRALSAACHSEAPTASHPEHPTASHPEHPTACHPEHSTACHPEHSTACHPERSEGSSLVFIHDGARPFVTQDMLRDLFDAAVETGAAVAAMPVKNTIKIADKDAFVIDTPDRATLWEMQTPQVFSYGLINRCYLTYLEELTEGKDLPPGGKVAPKATDEGCSVLSSPTPFIPTDDAQLVERYSDVRVKLVKTSYANLKITTPEDLVVAETILKT